MKVLVTGGNGFVGSYLVELLLRQGAEVGVLAEHSDRSAGILHAKTALTILQGDIRSAESVQEAVRQFGPNQIYHLAAVTAVPRSLQDPVRAYVTNMVGTLHVLQAARSSPSPPRILYASTAQVYDASAGTGPLTETTPTEPETPYAASKLCAEIVARQYQISWDLAVVIVRPFNCIGPRQSPEFVCSDFARQIAEMARGLRQPVLRVGNLSRKRDFTDVRDAVEAFSLAMEKGEPGEVYNICSGESHTIQEVVEILSGLAGQKIAVESDADRKRAKDPGEIVGDWSKLNRRTGWRPHIPFHQSLADLLEYWMSRSAPESTL